MPSEPSSAGPPRSALAAFGAAGAKPVLLSGGAGTSWVAGDIVLKPADLGMAELEWQAGVCAQVSRVGFRLAAPRAAPDGSLCVDGWRASEYVSGQHEPRRWAEIIAVGERFHAALRGVSRPAFLDQRSSPWANGDRIAWAELPSSEIPQVSHLARLTAAIRPVTAPSQVIHGDLSGNVLFDGRSPPAIIDFSPYWRPVGYASAIVVADALVWEGADPQVLDLISQADFGQYLVRALIFRLAAEWLLTRYDEPAPAGAREDRLARAVDLACRTAAVS